MIKLVTGGARSGKSSFAEDVFKDRDNVVYIATALVSDREMEDRVRLHREARNPNWRTYEAYKDLSLAVGSESYYILDCITIMISNFMFNRTEGLDRISQEIQEEIEEAVLEEIEKLVEAIKKVKGELVIVSNEVGLGIVPEHHISRVFRDIHGRVNQSLAKLSDQVYFLVSGLGVRIK